MEALRSALAPSPCVVLDRPPEVEIDRHGQVDAGARELMRRVKERFDPEACGAGAVVSGPITIPAWDSERPPEPSLIDDCVHCGFCLPTCPTYSLWGEEADSPRGRIVLMDEGHHSQLSAPMVGHLDNCLGCMACVTACPSGVQYDRLIEDTRGTGGAQVAAAAARAPHAPGRVRAGPAPPPAARPRAARARRPAGAPGAVRAHP